MPSLGQMKELITRSVPVPWTTSAVFGEYGYIPKAKLMALKTGVCSMYGRIIVPAPRSFDTPGRSSGAIHDMTPLFTSGYSQDVVP